jgi:hypothetical protein
VKKEVFHGPARARKLVILPDAHASPKYDHRRFDVLGAFLADEQPDVLVCLGDLNDLDSLAHHGRGTVDFEGRRYVKDCEASLAAQEALGLRRLKKTRKILTLGNHEQRIVTYQSEHQELVGAIGIDDLGYRENGWDVVPFKVPAIVGGIAFAHYFVSGPMERPVAQKGAALMKACGMSAVQGHGHTLDVAESTTIDGRKQIGIAAGCYVHPNATEGWNRGSSHLYWNGVLVLEDVRDGYYGSLRLVTQEHLRRRYR